MAPAGVCACFSVPPLPGASPQRCRGSAAAAGGSEPPILKKAARHGYICGGRRSEAHGTAAAARRSEARPAGEGCRGGCRLDGMEGPADEDL
eukprot:307924-Chlamydomonas_euryale.AAC.3